jgi:hypothetical protein
VTSLPQCRMNARAPSRRLLSKRYPSP